MKIRLLSLLLLLLFTSVTPVMGAPPPKGAPAGYEAKFKEVVEAEKAEEYEKALTLIDQIPSAKYTVYTRLKRASLLVRLGKFTEAEAMLTALLKDPAASVVRVTVQSDLDDLRARMPKLTIRLADGNKSDAWVTVDEKPIGPPVTLPLDPGTHVVVAKKGTIEIFRQKVTLQDSQTLEIEIDTSIVPPVGNVSAPTPPPMTPPPKKEEPEPDAPSGLRRAAPAFATSGVFVVGSVVSFLVMSSSQSSAESECATQHALECDSSSAGVGRVRTWQTLGWISAGAAVAALGVGVVLWSTTEPGKEKRAVATAAPIITQSSFGLSFVGRF